MHTPTSTVPLSVGTGRVGAERSDRPFKALEGLFFLGEGRSPEGKCSSVCCFAAVMISFGLRPALHNSGRYDLWPVR